MSEIKEVEKLESPVEISDTIAKKAGKGRPKKIVSNNENQMKLSENGDNETIDNVEKKIGKGRPKKNITYNKESDGQESGEEPEVKKHFRGRPKKSEPQSKLKEKVSGSDNEANDIVVDKTERNRAKKNVCYNEKNSNVSDSGDETKKKGKGRPKKVESHNKLKEKRLKKSKTGDVYIAKKGRNRPKKNISYKEENDSNASDDDFVTKKVIRDRGKKNISYNEDDSNVSESEDEVVIKSKGRSKNDNKKNKSDDSDDEAIETSNVKKRGRPKKAVSNDESKSTGSSEVSKSSKHEDIVLKEAHVVMEEVSHEQLSKTIENDVKENEVKNGDRKRLADNSDTAADESKAKKNRGRPKKN